MLRDYSSEAIYQSIIQIEIIQTIIITNNHWFNQQSSSVVLSLGDAGQRWKGLLFFENKCPFLLILVDVAFDVAFVDEIGNDANALV